MTLLIIGLLLFLGVHSVRIVAKDFRSAQIARIGPVAWKGLFAVASLVGFGLLVWGYGIARQQPVVLWPSPAWLRPAAALLMLVSFVFLAATYVPGNGIKARLQHPMVLGVKVWALAHLLANNTLADLILFGSFLIWAVFSFRAAKARDRAAGTSRAAGSAARTVITVVVGAAAWAAFALLAHRPLIGVGVAG